jgi:hypothetical protein
MILKIDLRKVALNIFSHIDVYMYVPTVHSSQSANTNQDFTLEHFTALQRNARLRTII